MAPKASALIGVLLASGLFAGAASAQSARGGEAMAQGTPAAAPAAAEGAGAHSMSGTITSIDDTGIVGLKTAVGELKLHFPPTALKDVKPGDTIKVHLSFEKS